LVAEFKASSWIVRRRQLAVFSQLELQKFEDWAREILKRRGTSEAKMKNLLWAAKLRLSNR
jgi:hypothetical protein